MEKRLELLRREDYFHSFSKFLIEKWSDSSEEGKVGLSNVKKTAYTRLSYRLKGKNVAKPATLRSWLGIGSSSKPGREHLFKLALALELSPEETQEYLQRGLLMPGIQINDYREVIYCYGLEKHLSYEECLGMIEIFEAQLYQDYVIEQKTHTDELWTAFEEWKRLDQIHFLKILCENAGKFKGYGKTALNYFVKYKNEILGFVKEEAKEQLQNKLQEIHFYSWAKEKKIAKEEYPEAVLRYLKNINRRRNPEINKDILEEIKYLCWIAYAKENRNASLLAELYSSAIQHKEGKGQKSPYRSRREFALPDGIKFPSNSHLSQVLGIALHKEKELRIAQGLAWVSHKPGEESCPQWIEEIIENYTSDRGPFTCVAAQKCLKRLQTKQKKQCVMLQRDDLLPLIHYVAQKQYEIRYGEKYEMWKAKELFVTLADSTLIACQMAPLSESFELDFLLLSCYRDKGMYSMAEAIEMSMK